MDFGIHLTATICTVFMPTSLRLMKVHSAARTAHSTRTGASDPLDMNDLSVNTSLVMRAFWCIATLTAILAIRFTVKLRGMETADVPTTQSPLARSQEKDDWLLCGVIWSAFFMDGWQFQDAALTVEALVLLWIARRTLQRHRLLR